MNLNELFKLTLNNEMKTYGLSLNTEVQQKLTDYFDLLSRWNGRLHLVAPTSPEEFATRHVLESLVLLNYLPSKAAVVDVGSGGGLPLIPCLIARPDLQGVLIESSTKKGVFLREGVNRLGLSNRTKVLVQRFEETGPVQAGFVTCRALENLVLQVPAILKWAPEGSRFLLFGSHFLGLALEEIGAEFEKILLPLSDRRFLFVTKGRATDFTDETDS